MYGAHLAHADPTNDQNHDVRTELSRRSRCARSMAASPTTPSTTLFHNALSLVLPRRYAETTLMSPGASSAS